MPYTWDDRYIESKADKRTDILGFGEIGGVGQLIYHIFRFQEYETGVDKDGRYYVRGICKPGCGPVLVEDGAYTGKDILSSLCNLAKAIDDRAETRPCEEMILAWCRQNAHPYAVDSIFNGLSDAQYDAATDGFLIEHDSFFYVDDFMADLGKLYNAARFYTALDGICVAEDEAAYNMYQEGRCFEALPVFERFKTYTPEVPDEVLAPANGDMLKEMQLANEYIDAHAREVPEGEFAEEPYDSYEELRDRLIECIPDFRLRLKTNPKTNRLVFSADIESVFEIAWYTLARLLSEDPAPEDKGKDDDRSEGIMVCCRKCGDFIIRRNSRQEYCDKPDCQKARNAKNQREFRKRKREEKAHSKADTGTI